MGLHDTAQIIEIRQLADSRLHELQIRDRMIEDLESEIHYLRLRLAMAYIKLEQGRGRRESN
jgi:hypothetical protein